MMDKIISFVEREFILSVGIWMILNLVIGCLFYLLVPMKPQTSALLTLAVFIPVYLVGLYGICKLNNVNIFKVRNR